MVTVGLVASAVRLPLSCIAAESSIREGGSDTERHGFDVFDTGEYPHLEFNKPQAIGEES